MRYLEKVDQFRGDGSRNENGQSLDEFLDSYDARKYDCPSNTVDMIIIRPGTGEDDMRLLLIRRKNHPSIGYWALPGGFVNFREDLADAAARELQEETGLTGIPMVQLRTWGQPDRDPRWRVITTAFLAVVEGELPAKAGDDAADAGWFRVSLKKTGENIPEGSVNLKKEEYLLELREDERGLNLSARVSRTVEKAGILTRDGYELLENHRIAMHHAQIITDALLQVTWGQVPDDL